MTGPCVDFWFEFASTYSYLTAMRIESAAQSAGVSARWRPFLLGPVFKAQGLETSPFNLFPLKGRYMMRDMERQCAALGIPFRQPDPFPQNGLLAARVAVAALKEGWGEAFCKAVYLAEFGDGAQIGEREVIAGIITGLGQDADAVLERAQSDAVKSELRANTEEAQRLAIFGAPMLVTEDGELFWGNDRLEQALDWARLQAGRQAAAETA